MNNPDMKQRAKSLSRFWAKVNVGAPSDCWPWLGRLHGGYGHFHFEGMGMKAHRASFILSGGTIEAGNVVDHMCRNRACVNPAHLRQVSPLRNTLENSEAPTAINAHKTHCPKGHPLSGDNLLKWRLKLGWRSCRTCDIASQARRKIERKAKLLEVTR